MSTVRQIKRGNLRVIQSPIPPHDTQVVKVLKGNNRKKTLGRRMRNDFNYTLRYICGDVILLNSGSTVFKTKLTNLDKLVNENKVYKNKKGFLDLTTNEKINFILTLFK